MLRRVGLLVLTSLLVLLVILNHVPATAQGGPNARSSANLHMRTGPGKSYPSITIIDAGTGLFLEARTGDTSWLLAHTEDGQFRGWITNLHLDFAPGFNAATLPLSAEIVNPAQPAAPAGPANPANPPNAPNQPAATSTPAPIHLPPNSAALNQRLRGIYQRVRQLGNRADAFTRLGDSIIAYHLLHAFADRSKYNLGNYGYLQTTVNFFNQSHSLDALNLTAATGYTVATILDPIWADPRFCIGGENLLACEIRTKKPGIALVYLGPNDLHSFPLRDFAWNMDQAVQQMIDQGVIPVLITFAVRADRLPDKVPLYIGVIRDTAARKQVPLIDFYEAAKKLPDNGVVQDAFHLTHREDWSILFTAINIDMEKPCSNCSRCKCLTTSAATCPELGFALFAGS